MASNGKIYFAPYKANQVFSIDPETGVVATVGPELEGDGTYAAGGVMASNGEVYFVPYKVSQVLSISHRLASLKRWAQYLRAMKNTWREALWLRMEKSTSHLTYPSRF